MNEEINNQQQNAFFSYFDRKIADCRQRETVLLKDDRTDEAVFEKIRANVYNIFKTIFTTAIKTSKDHDSDDVQRFFLLKTEQIPASWRESYCKAKQYEDTEKMQLELIKLETAEEIRSAFIHLWEEKQ